MGSTMDRILIFTYNAGYRHSYITTAVEILTKLGERTGIFEVYATEDLEEFNENTLNSFDVVVFLTSGEIPFSERQRNLFTEFIENGGGFIGVHNAADTLYSYTPYGEILGGYFHSHPWTQEAVFIVEDPHHPSTKHLSKSFKVYEEIYVFKNWIGRNRTNVLISLDTSSVDLSKSPKDAVEYPMAWCHSYRNGRVFYTAFGHQTKRWREEWFQKHILGGIAWVLNKEIQLSNT
uniref:ThuA domain-containing protein n=1 Tax=Ignisphaera aggregans TaxID=334771 RepID=A0A7J3JPX6_9CREN